MFKLKEGSKPWYILSGCLIIILLIMTILPGKPDKEEIIRQAVMNALPENGNLYDAGLNFAYTADVGIDILAIVPAQVKIGSHTADTYGYSADILFTGEAVTGNSGYGYICRFDNMTDILVNETYNGLATVSDNYTDDTVTYYTINNDFSEGTSYYLDNGTGIWVYEPMTADTIYGTTAINGREALTSFIASNSVLEGEITENGRTYYKFSYSFSLNDKNLAAFIRENTQNEIFNAERLLNILTKYGEYITAFGTYHIDKESLTFGYFADIDFSESNLLALTAMFRSDYAYAFGDGSDISVDINRFYISLSEINNTVMDLTSMEIPKEALNAVSLDEFMEQYEIYETADTADDNKLTAEDYENMTIPEFEGGYESMEHIGEDTDMTISGNETDLGGIPYGELTEEQQESVSFIMEDFLSGEWQR